MITEAVKFQRKELELKALLEITQAINENKREAVLLEIFKFTCLVHLNIKSLILYVADNEGFTERVAHNIKSRTPKAIPYRDVQENKEIGKLNLVMSAEYSYGELDIYVPVYHKDKMFAMSLLTKTEEDRELDLDFTQALTNRMVVALENKRFAQKELEQEKLNKGIEVASNVQRMMFPAELQE